MGLHASYYPISPTKLDNFTMNVHSEKFYWEISSFIKESQKNGLEFYVGTAWHVLDFLVNPPDAVFLELMYAVRGHEFPAPDGSVCPNPHLASYDDDFWQTFTYVTVEEVQVISQYLTLMDESELEARFVPQKMKGIYRAPLNGALDKSEYFEKLTGLKVFYKKAAESKMAVLIDFG